MKRIILLMLVIMLLIPVMASCKKEDACSDFGLFANNFAAYYGWIYYTEWSSGDLCKVKQDGSERTIIGDIKTKFFRIYEDSIFYVDRDSKALYCTDLDGNTIQQDNEFIGADKFYIVDGWVYSLESRKVIHKTKLDGTESKSLGSGNESCGDFCIDGELIYYTVFKPIDGKWGFVLYKMRTDGTQRTQLMEQNALAIGYAEDWIYFVDMAGNGVGESTNGQSICKVRFDGSERQKLTDSDMCWNSFFKVVGDSIYYEDLGEDAGLYKVDTDSGERTKIIESYRVGDISIWGNWMVYPCLDLESDEPYIQMIRIEDSKSTDQFIDVIIADMDIEVRKYE